MTQTGPKCKLCGDFPLYCRCPIQKAGEEISALRGQVAKLEALIARHEFVRIAETYDTARIVFCPACGARGENHEPGCQWGEVAANHHKRAGGGS